MNDGSVTPNSASSLGAENYYMAATPKAVEPTSAPTPAATPTPRERKKHDRFNGMTEEEVCKRILPDHLDNNLDIIIVSVYVDLNAFFLNLLFGYLEHESWQQKQWRSFESVILQIMDVQRVLVNFYRTRSIYEKRYSWAELAVALCTREPCPPRCNQNANNICIYFLFTVMYFFPVVCDVWVSQVLSQYSIVDGHTTKSLLIFWSRRWWIIAVVELICRLGMVWFL